MCLIVFAWRPEHPQPLIVAANRDEFYARPSLALAHWEDRPGIYAGRDLKAGGTWLGISSSSIGPLGHSGAASKAMAVLKRYIPVSIRPCTGRLPPKLEGGKRAAMIRV